MEFRILGPLEVEQDGRPLPLGGPRQRALLSLLLLHANEVVPRDRLIDELWGDAPPETARTALQLHVSQLRKVLGSDLIVTRAPGYVLRTAVGECHLRGELTQVALDDNVTLETDSNEDPWDRTVNHAFRIQEVGRLVDELEDFRCEPEMDPSSNVLRLYNRRGQDRSGDVTVEAPYGLSLTGRGVQATRYFYETQGGFGRAVNEQAESELGVVMASVAQFGTSPGPDEHGQPVTDRLLADGRMASELEILLPDDIVPYEDVFLGDVVTCVADVDGSEGPVRLTSFSLELDDAGQEVWAVTAEPVLP